MEESHETAGGAPKAAMRDRREIAEIVFNEWKTSQRATFEVAAAYSRWLTSTLVLIHAGALFGMFSFLDSVADKPDVLSGYGLPIWCFVLGLLLALLSGFAAWLNWSMHSFNYGRQAVTTMLWDPKTWLADPYYTRGLSVTHWTSIVSGLLSAAMIPAGTAMAMHRSAIQALIGLD